MGQYWKILNVDAREVLDNPGSVKLDGILYGDVAASIVPYLALPPLPDAVTYLTQPTGLTLSTARDSFTALPVELLHHITTFLSPDDLICFGLASQTLLSQLYARIRKLLQEAAGPWAGNRIITLGDYASTLPPNLVSDEEIDEIYREHNGYVDDDEVWPPEDTPRTLYSIADYGYHKATRNNLFERAMYRLNVAEQRVLFASRPSSSFSSERSGLSSPQPVEWILRDLTKRQYVRGSVLARFSSGVPPNGPFIQPVGFGEVVVIRTSYTDDPSGTVGAMHGRWAGDRLDIVTLEQFERESRKTGENLEPWVDVSVQAARDLFNGLRDKIHEHYMEHRPSPVDPDETEDEYEDDNYTDQDWLLEAFEDEFAWVENGGGWECDVEDCAATFDSRSDLRTHRRMHWEQERAARMQAH